MPTPYDNNDQSEATLKHMEKWLATNQRVCPQCGEESWNVSAMEIPEGPVLFIVTAPTHITLEQSSALNAALEAIAPGRSVRLYVQPTVKIQVLTDSELALMGLQRIQGA